MKEISLRDKDISIKNVAIKILTYFGSDFFERNIADSNSKLVDY